MVIKGTSCAGARRLAVHLTRTDTNERVEVKQLRGVAATDLRGALLEMEAVATGARSGKPFYHGSINTRAEERLNDDQRMRAIDRLEAALGLSGQPRVVVVHERAGREHCHIVWSRIDLGRMAAISNSHNYRKHEEVSRILEREFGHERVQGAHVEREGKRRPTRTPSHAEMSQAERTGLSPKRAKEKITELWRSTDTGQAFANALDHHGWVLARGDRRDFVVVDPKGGTHSLARRIEGANARDVRERLADVDLTRLPSVAEAREIQRSRQAPETKRARKRPAFEPGPRPGRSAAATWAASAAAMVKPNIGGQRSIAGNPRPERDASSRRGAAAAPDSQSDQLRVRTKRRTGGNGSTGFGIYLRRVPHSNGQPSLPVVPRLGGFICWSADEARTRGEFRAQACWMPARVSASVDTADGIADAGEDTELAQILDAIVADVQRNAAGARDAVMAEYAAKITHARKTLPRHQAAGAVRAFMDAQAAALTHIAKEASAEIAGRRAAAMNARRRKRGAVKPTIWGGPPEGPTPN
jgi:hypothetical protein